MKLISSETFGSMTNANNGKIATASVYVSHWPHWFQVVFVGLIGLGLQLLLLPGKNQTEKGQWGI